MTFQREREVISYLQQFGISQAIPGGPELKTGICLGLENKELLQSPTDILYAAVAERLGMPTRAACAHMTKQIKNVSSLEKNIPLFTLLGIGRIRPGPTPAKFIARSVTYLQVWTDVFSSEKVNLRTLYLKDPEAMSSREKLLFMYYFAINMSGAITSYLMLPTGRMDDYGSGVEAKERALLIQGFAGVAANLMRGPDSEITAGIKALSDDFRQGNRYGISADPMGFYRRMKAIAAMCRHYYIGLDDGVIAWHIMRERPSYPDVPERFFIHPLPRWLRETVMLCQSEPNHDTGRKAIEDCVQDSFLNDAMRSNWRYNTRFTTPEYLEPHTSPMDAHSSFIFQVSPMTVLLDYEITMQLANEARALNQ